jgi:DNA-binding CsgD family transcriptional regulator/tetratricopeptide (TPR) repeat protein
MPGRYSAGQADFGTAFTALLAAAGLTVDGVLRALPEDRRGRVSRSTLYGWKKGQHLPLDASGALLEVVRVCLDAARQREAGLGVSPGSEDGWRRLLAEARQVRDAEMVLDRCARGDEPGSAWHESPVDGQDPARLGMPLGIKAGRPSGGGVFVGRAEELAVLEAAAAEACGGHPKVVLVEGEAGIGKSSLLARFAGALTDAAVLRASGDEAELLVSYGMVGQLVASAQGAGNGLPGLLTSDLTGAVDPLAVGAELVMWLGQVGRGQKMVLACIDDLQWADGPSARALLFAVRRLQAHQVLVVVSARAGELSGLGEGWPRFVAGDHRADRVLLGGLGPEDVVALGRTLGAGELPRRAVGRLLEYTGGNPMYIRAVLEESGAKGLDRPGGTVGVPRSLAAMVLARVGALSPAARQLVSAAAVLGYHCPLAVAAALAALDDPLPALEEAMAAGVLVERPGAAAGIGFPHLLVHRAVYYDLSPTRRRRLHARAACLVERRQALVHQVAASVAPDDELAEKLEAAGREARELGRLAQAADWVAQAAAASSDPAAADRRLLDALEILVSYGEVARAESLATQVESAAASPRRYWLLGTLDFLAGRVAAAEARLVQAWQAHDPARNASVGAAAAAQLAAFCTMQGRAAEAVGWGERAARVDAAPAAVRHRAQGMLAIARVVAGQGPLGLSGLAFLPAAPSEVPREDTDTLVYRGMARAWTEDFAGAVADLSAAAARLRAGVLLRDAGPCLGYLAGAEYRLGSWDDAAVHAELAVSLAHDADRVRDLGLVHSIAALVPAARGDWELADAHVRMATEAAQAIGIPVATIAAATARAFLATARGDLEEVTDAAAAVRATGIAEYGLISPTDWRCLEIAALIGQRRLGHAETALAELEAALEPAGPPVALAVAAWLRGDLAAAAGHEAAADAFQTAWRHVQGLRVPLALAQLEISDARRLRAVGQTQAAVARLRSARQRLVTLGARPYLQACDRELAATAAPVEPETIPAFVGLTAAEQAVARLVVTGHSNRQAAAKLYVSVKTVESHLGHIFAKLGIRSRHDLITAAVVVTVILIAILVVTGHSNRQVAAELYVSVKTVESHLGHIFAKLGIRSRQDLITRIGAPKTCPNHNQGHS